MEAMEIEKKLKNRRASISQLEAWRYSSGKAHIHLQIQLQIPILNPSNLPEDFPEYASKHSREH